MSSKLLRMQSKFYIYYLKLMNNLLKDREYKRDEIKGDFHIIYRISDAGYPKRKLDNINNENCLKNAINEFPLSEFDWTVICDNCSELTMKMVRSFLPEKCIICVNVGHGAGTFNMALDKALSYSDDDVVYFLENDYLHNKNAKSVLYDGFNVSCQDDYVTLYDHPDKYDFNHPFYNYMQNHTKIYCGSVCHWKTAFSTTMTFAARVRTLRKDEKIWREWTSGKHPYDFEIFVNLQRKGRNLLSPLPGAATHGEIEFLSPFVNWKEF